MSTQDLITHVAANFSRIYLGGIPSLLNDDGAFLSFICSLTAIEALGGFLSPQGRKRRALQDVRPALLTRSVPGAERCAMEVAQRGRAWVLARAI